MAVATRRATLLRMTRLAALVATGLALAAPAPPRGAVHAYRFDPELDGRSPREHVLVYELRPRRGEASTRAEVWRQAGARWVRVQRLVGRKLGAKGLLGAWLRDFDGDGREELIWLDDERRGQTVHIYRQLPRRTVFAFVQVLASARTGFANGEVALLRGEAPSVWRPERPGGRWVCRSGCTSP